MALTEEQLASWNDLWPEGPARDARETEDFQVMSLQYVFQFEGLDVPSEADVLAELRNRQGKT